MSSLSPAALELIQKARIVSFLAWDDNYSQEIIQIFQSADNQGRYLTDDDLMLLERSPLFEAETVNLYSQLRLAVTDIVDEARASVLSHFPNIIKPGGGLYPAARAEACWRDFWHFLRCISYGIAAQKTEFTSSEGLHYMQLLYKELKVPLEAMIFGLETIKSASLRRFNPSQKLALAPYFDHMILQLTKFLEASTQEQ